MRSAADEIHAIQFLEPIARTQMEHLIETMRKVERCATIDLVLVVPLDRRDDAFVENAFGRNFESGLFDLSHHERFVAIAFFGPIDIGMLMRDGSKNVQCGFAAWSEG